MTIMAIYLYDSYRISEGLHWVIPMLLIDLVADFVSNIVKSFETYLHVLRQLTHCGKIPSRINCFLSPLGDLIVKEKYYIYGFKFNILDICIPSNSFCEENKFIKRPINIKYVVNNVDEGNGFCELNSLL